MIFSKTARFQPRLSSRVQASSKVLPRPCTPPLPRASLDIAPPVMLSRFRRMIPDTDTYSAFMTMLAANESPRVVDVAFDIGRPVTLHYDGHVPVPIAGSTVVPGDIDALLEASSVDDHILQTTGRAGVYGTLHRMSILHDFDGSITGLTLRIGRYVPMHDVLPDDLKNMVAMKKSILLFGPPGSGKTTLLRALAEFSGDYVPQRTVVVDASGELGGTGTDVLGTYTRRACVAPGHDMASTMLHAIRNHTPEALIVDELVSVSDASAAQTCSLRGVQLIASAHAKNIETLLQNPIFRDKLFGGVQHAAIGDTEAKMLGKKFVKERKAEPVFDAAYDCTTRTLYESLVCIIDEHL